MNSATELAVIGIAGVELTPTSLKIPSGISPGDYRHIGRSLGRIIGMSAWAVGDWVNANPNTSKEVTQDIADLVGLSISTVKTYAAIAARYPVVERRGVPWGVHQSLAFMPSEARARALDKAEREGWSAARARLHVNGKPVPKQLKAGTVEHVSPVVHLEVEWKPEYADDADLVKTLNVELRRMVESWSYVKDVKIVAADEPVKP